MSDLTLKKDKLPFQCYNCNTIVNDLLLKRCPNCGMILNPNSYINWKNSFYCFLIVLCSIPILMAVIVSILYL